MIKLSYCCEVEAKILKMSLWEEVFDIILPTFSLELSPTRVSPMNETKLDAFCFDL